MFYIFGDLHGNYEGELSFLNSKNFPEQKTMTKKDILFQLGDFGYLWFYPQAKQKFEKDMNQIAEIASKNYELIIIPGNHENHELINELPLINKYEGHMRELKTKKGSVFFAVNGEIYKIKGKSFFTFGGAKSNDREDRISKEEYLKRKSSKNYKERIGITKINYWTGEIPSIKDFKNALKNLKKENFKVDYVLSHTAPNSILDIVITDKAKLTDLTAKMLEKIYKKIKFQKWYFGHIHKNIEIKNFISHYAKKPLKII